MMGWRVGYIAYPVFEGSNSLGAQLLKVQDSVPICASTLSQNVALAALNVGTSWVDERIAKLTPNRCAAVQHDLRA